MVRASSLLQTIMLSALNRSAPRLLVPAISNASTKTPFRRLSTIASARRYVSPARLACTPTSRGFRSAPPRASMNAAEYSKLSDETMETLYEALDNWCEANDGVDVDYSVRGCLLPPSPPPPSLAGSHQNADACVCGPHGRAVS